MFKVGKPDYDLSPYTGLTRESWLEAGKYLLEGIFRHIEDMEHPVVVPRTETEITYPHLKASAETQKVQRAAEVFEGLTRSFFIAAPLLQNIPDLEVCGFPMAEYYKKQVLYVCTKGHPLYVGTYAEQQEITGYENPFRTFQQTVETCALVICLWICKEELWDTYTREEKDRIHMAEQVQLCREFAAECGCLEGPFPFPSPHTRFSYLDRKDIHLIRPMLYMQEADVVGFIKRSGAPVVHNPCPANGYTKRQYAKELLAELSRENRGLKERIFTAMTNGLENYRKDEMK